MDIDLTNLILIISLFLIIIFINAVINIYRLLKAKWKEKENRQQLQYIDSLCQESTLPIRTDDKLNLKNKDNKSKDENKM